MSPADLAADSAAVAAVGVDAVHVHVKDPGSGLDTLDAAPLADVLDRVRAAVPGLPIGVTTGAWAEPEVEARLAAIRAWSRLPDFASVNWHEDGAELVAEALLQQGVGVEAGLWHADAVRAWCRSGLGADCVRVLIELPDGLDRDATLIEADRLLTLCEPALAAGAMIVLHGEGSSCWPAFRHARDRGLGSRIGLEDTLVLPDGRPARGNAELVSHARQLETDR